MKKVLCLLVICFTATLIFAQPGRYKKKPKFELGVIGGLNIPKLQGGGGNPISEGWKSRLGYAAGITTSVDLGKNFSVQAEALYSNEGGKHDGLQAIDASSLNPQAPAGTYFYADFHNESILNYFEIPVMLKYSIPVTRSSAFYIDFGPYVGYLLNAKQKTSGSSIVYADNAATIPVSVNPQTGEPVPVSFDADTNITSQINKINFGITGGIGFSKEIGPGEISLDLRGAYGLTNIQNDPKNGKSNTGNLLIAICYSFPL
jgi:hypothetical protein